MSYSEYEVSTERGSLIRLYEFERGSLRWRYTNANRDITWGGNVYTHIAMLDEGITQSGEATSNTFTVTLPDDNDVVALYRSTPPSDSIFLTVRNLQEFDGTQEAPIQWIGYISDVQRPTIGQASIVCQTLSASFQRPGLRLTWMRTCPHALYDEQCSVNKSGYANNGTVTSMDGISVVSAGLAGYPLDYFSGGFLEWEIATGVFERRGIERYTQDGTMRMFGRTDGMTVGMFFVAYPGCSRTIQTCHEKFNNKDNYGGIVHLPGFSPFDGSPVFN